MHKIPIFACALVLISASIAQANSVEDMYGDWNGSWTWNTIYYHPGDDPSGPINSFHRQPDDTWIGNVDLPGWFYVYLDPNASKFMSVNLHELDADGSYGSLHAQFSPGSFFDGLITGLSLTESFFDLSILYDSGNTARIYGTFDEGVFSDVHFDETDTPLPHYISAQGQVTDLAAVPEPSTIMLLGLGLVGVFPLRRRLKRQ